MFSFNSDPLHTLGGIRKKHPSGLMTAHGKSAEPMVRVRRVRNIMIAVLLGCLFVVPSAPASPFKFFGFQQMLDQQEKISIHQAVRQVKSSHSGKVLGAETRVEQGRNVHIIKLVTEDGVIRRIRVDAESGAMSDH